MFLGRWNTSLHQLGYMIGKDVSVGYTVGWGCVSWLHYSCRQHSDPIAQHGDLVTAEEVSVVYIIGWGCVSWLQRCWGCVSRLYSKMRLCQLVTLWDGAVAVGYTVGWGCVSWLHSGMRLCQLVTVWWGCQLVTWWLQAVAVKERHSDPIAQQNGALATAEEVHSYITQLGISTVCWSGGLPPPPPSHWSSTHSHTPPSPFIYLCHPPMVPTTTTPISCLC